MIRPIQPHCPRRRAFTLVEMMISIGLVVLMMSLFASIFQMASGTVQVQRGIAENDQRARAIEMLMRADLHKRTFRNMIPFVRNETSDESITRFSNREGYFYISEGHPDIDTDDMFQFTVRSTISRGNTDESVYYGRATQLGGNFLQNPNQPEADDGYIQPNATASSTAAEISWFLRGGNLYRRVMLIREPLEVSGADPQPTNANGEDYFNPPSRYTGNFWNDFDFSAYYSTTGARFHGLEALDNTATVLRLGMPQFRFGHSSSTAQPKEYATRSGKRVFMGRFTHQETSAPDIVDAMGNVTRAGFRYPHWLGASPMEPGSAITLDDDYVATAYSHGQRRSEDLVLSNVQSMDVEVWDDRLKDFADIGHSRTLESSKGDFHLDARLNADYGNVSLLDNEKRVFDTWHPAAFVNDSAGDPVVNPPFLPREEYALDQYASATTYAVEKLVFPPVTTPDFIGQNQLIYLKCEAAGSDVTGDLNLQDAKPGTTISGTLPDGTNDGYIWRIFTNVKSVKAIRIKVRFLDLTSGQLRQISVVHSLTD